jgi:lipoprotein-releasing system permease protein
MSELAGESAEKSGARTVSPVSFLEAWLPLEIFLALRYLKLWRAIAGCLLLSVIVVGLVLFGADLVYALTQWRFGEKPEIFKSAARLVVFAVTVALAAWGIIRLGRGHSGGVIMGIAIYGVTIGVAVLIIVLAVMSGFDQQMREKILGMDSHVTVTDPNTNIVRKPSEALETIKRAPHVKGAAPYVVGHVLIEAHGKIAPALMKGIDPQREGEVSELPKWMVGGRLDLSGDSVVIGDQLARQLKVFLGDKITVYAPRDFDAFKNRDEAHLPTELEVTGIFRVDMYEFDSKFIYVSLGNARELYVIEEGAHAIGVRLDDAWNAEIVRQHLNKTLPDGLTAITWAQLNRPIFAALRTEKAVMFFILLIITVVAAFGIASTLFTVSIQKTREIGLLQSLGATSGRIVSVFVLLGFLVGLTGTLMGVGHGLLALYYRNDVLNWLTALTGWQLFPVEIYNFSELPAVVNQGDVTVIALAALVICTLAGVAPAIRSARLNPVEALRYE